MSFVDFVFWGSVVGAMIALVWHMIDILRGN